MGRPFPQGEITKHNRQTKQIPINPVHIHTLPLYALLSHKSKKGYLRLATERLQLLEHRCLGVNLLQLGVLQLLTTSKAHLQVLNGPDLLLQTANLLSVWVLRRWLSWGIRGRTGLLVLLLMLSVLDTVLATGALLSVASAAVHVVAGPAPEVAAVLVATGHSAPLGAATLVARATAVFLRRRRKAGPSVRLRLQLAVGVVVLLAALLLVLLGAAVFVGGLRTRHSPDGRDVLGQLGAGNGASGSAEAVGTHVLGAVADDVSGAALILALEVKRRGQSTSARRSVGSRRFAGRLDGAEEGRGRFVRCRDRAERISGLEASCVGGSPENVVQLDHIFVVHESSGDVPQLDAIVDAQSRGGRGRHDVTAVGAPFAHARVAALNGANLSVVLFEVVHVDLAGKIAEAGNEDEATGGREGNGVARAEGERVHGNTAVVENGRLRWHITIDNTKLSGRRRPRDVVDRTLLVQRHASVQSAVGAQQVESRLSVVALARAVHVGLSQDQEAGSPLVPLQLDLVALEEGLLRDWVLKFGHLEDFDGGGGSLKLSHMLESKARKKRRRGKDDAYLALRDKDGHSVVLARSQSKVGGTLDAQLVPNGDEVMALEELHLVGDEAGAVGLIGGVLQVPAALLLLDKLADRHLGGSIDAVLDGAPDLEVLGGVAGLVLGRPLPGDDKGAQGREAELVDVGNGQAQDELAAGGIDDIEGLGGCPAKEAAARRVRTAPQVSLGLGEPRKGRVDRGGVKDADGLLGSVGELQRGCHG